MQTMTPHWKNRIDDLLAHAVDVRRADIVTPAMSARAVARCLSGVVHLIAGSVGIAAMQESCAEIVRSAKAWRTGLRELPRAHDGMVRDPVKLLGVVAAGFLPVAGEHAVRSALAFWATEDDVEAMRQVAGR